MSDDYLLLDNYNQGDKVKVTDGDYKGQIGFVHEKIQTDFGHAWLRIALGSQVVNVRTTHVQRNQERI